MKKLSRILRIVAYLSGMAGAACVIAGRQRYGDQSTLAFVGMGLMAVMFFTFFATFLLQAWSMMTRHAGTGRSAPRGRDEG